MVRPSFSLLDGTGSSLILPS